MGEFRFHHLERRRVDQALPDLIVRILPQGRRVVVRVPSAEMVEALNDRLWTYDDASFLPHGAAGDGDPATQPVYLTDGSRTRTTPACWWRWRARRPAPATPPSIW